MKFKKRKSPLKIVCQTKKSENLKHDNEISEVKNDVEMEKQENKDELGVFDMEDWNDDQWGAHCERESLRKQREGHYIMEKIPEEYFIQEWEPEEIKKTPQEILDQKKKQFPDDPKKKENAGIYKMAKIQEEFDLEVCISEILQRENENVQQPKKPFDKEQYEGEINLLKIEGVYQIEPLQEQLKRSPIEIKQEKRMQLSEVKNNLHVQKQHQKAEFKQKDFEKYQEQALFALDETTTESDMVKSEVSEMQSEEEESQEEKERLAIEKLTEKFRKEQAEIYQNQAEELQDEVDIEMEEMNEDWDVDIEKEELDKLYEKLKIAKKEWEAERMEKEQMEPKGLGAEEEEEGEGGEEGGAEGAIAHQERKYDKDGEVVNVNKQETQPLHTMQSLNVQKNANEEREIAAVEALIREWQNKDQEKMDVLVKEERRFKQLCRLEHIKKITMTERENRRLFERDAKLLGELGGLSDFNVMQQQIKSDSGSEAEYSIPKI